MTPELGEIIGESYRIFAPYTIGRTLDVCHCPCCMTEETERVLVATPLREIPSGTLAEYTNSAHGWDDGEVARQMRHFLPRYLELIALGEPPCNMGLDICLRRLGSAGWRSKWPAAEVDILDRFFDAFLRQGLADLELTQWPVGWRLASDMADVLTMAVTAGAEIGRLLAAWERAEDPGATLHMAALRDCVSITLRHTRFRSHYLNDHTEAAEAIGRFLVGPEADRRIERAFFLVEDPRLQQILSDALSA